MVYVSSFRTILFGVFKYTVRQWHTHMHYFYFKLFILFDLWNAGIWIDNLGTVSLIHYHTFLYKEKKLVASLCLYMCIRPSL